MLRRNARHTIFSRSGFCAFENNRRVSAICRLSAARYSRSAGEISVSFLPSRSLYILWFCAHSLFRFLPHKASSGKIGGLAKGRHAASSWVVGGLGSCGVMSGVLSALGCIFGRRLNNERSHI